MAAVTGRLRGAACLLVLAAAVLAAEGSGWRAHAQPPPAADTASGPSVYIARDINMAVSSKFKTTYEKVLRGTPEAVRLALPSVNVTVGRSTMGPAPNYKPISEDDIANALDPDAMKELHDIIRAGFPEADKPLVLLSLAERGTLLIGTVHLFSPAAADDEKLRQIDRHTINLSDLTAAHFESTWPDCVALAVKKALDPAVDLRKAAEGVLSCPRLTGEIPKSQKAATPKEPKPGKEPASRKNMASNAPPPGPPAATPPASAAPPPANPNARSMLDDVPADRNLRIVQPDGFQTNDKTPKPPSGPMIALPIPNVAPPPSATPPGGPLNPQVKPQGPGMLPPADQTPRVPPQALGAVKKEPLLIRPQANSEEHRVRMLLPEIYAAGLPWLPPDALRQSHIKAAFRELSRDLAETHDCLNAASYSMWLGKSTVPIAERLWDDLRLSRFEARETFLSNNLNYISIQPTRDASAGYRECFNTISRASRDVRLIELSPEAQRFAPHEIERRYNARQPTTFEAFLIAAHLLYRRAHLDYGGKALGFYFHDEFRGRESVFYYRLDPRWSADRQDIRLVAFDFVPEGSQVLQNVTKIGLFIPK